MAKVTKDMLIGQLLALNPNIAAILMRAPLRWNLWKKPQWFMEWMQIFWFSRSTIFWQNKTETDNERGTAGKLFLFCVNDFLYLDKNPANPSVRKH